MLSGCSEEYVPWIWKPQTHFFNGGIYIRLSIFILPQKVIKNTYTNTFLFQKGYCESQNVEDLNVRIKVNPLVISFMKNSYFSYFSLSLCVLVSTYRPIDWHFGITLLRYCGTNTLTLIHVPYSANKGHVEQCMANILCIKCGNIFRMFFFWFQKKFYLSFF